MRAQLALTRIDKLSQVVRSPKLLHALVSHGVLAGAEHRQVLTGDFLSVVDVGANKGQFALAARRWAPRARVISFEPLSRPAKIFREVFSRDPYVTLHQVAIGRESGQSAIHVSRKDDSSSLLPISELQEKLFPGTAERTTELVRVEPLHDLVSSREVVAPALLKLDVQGFEIAALQGCDRLLGRFDYVYAECSFVELYSGQSLAHQVVEYLGDRGFRLKGVYNMTYDYVGVAVQGDFLFSRE